MIRNFALTLILILGFAANVFSDDENDPRGRLPDGRAFRKDAEGTQLVDYIAELEVSVDTLTRKVNGLEDEVKEKQRLLETKGVTSDNAQQVSERTIVGGSSKDYKNTLKSVKAECPSCPESKCDTEVSAATKNISATCESIKTERDQFKAQVTSLSTRIDSLQDVLEGRESEVGVLKTKLDDTSLRDELKTARAELADAKQEQKETISELQDKIEELTEISKKSEAEALLLKTKYENLSSEASDLRIRDAQRRSHEEAVVADVRRSIKNSNEAEEMRASFSEARVKALDAIKGDLSSDVQRIKGLISDREKLYNLYKEQPHPVQFKITQPVSSRNRSLDAIKKQIGTARYVNELASLRIDLSEINKKVQDDIKLLERMRKVG